MHEVVCLSAEKKSWEVAGIEILDLKIKLELIMFWYLTVDSLLIRIFKPDNITLEITQPKKINSDVFIAHQIYLSPILFSQYRYNMANTEK